MTNETGSQLVAIAVDSELAADNPERLKVALKIAGANIAELNDKCAALVVTLNSALLLIDLMINDMRQANITPSVAIVVEKARLDQAMRKLLRKEN
jgi:hypothetical protein